MSSAHLLRLPPSWSINSNPFFVPQSTLAAAVRLTRSEQNEKLPGGLICAVCSSFKYNRKPSMPFMVHAALKAKSLNSCPGEANCRNAWHNGLWDVFQRNFSFSRDLTCRAFNVHREVVNAQKGIWHFQWFCVMFCRLRTERKGSCWLTVCYLFFPHLEDPGHSLSDFLLSALSWVRFLYCTVDCCQNRPSLLFVRLDWRSDLSSTRHFWPDAGLAERTGLNSAQVSYNNWWFLLNWYSIL